MANRRTFLASLAGGVVALKELPAVMAMPVAVEQEVLRDDGPELQRRIDAGEVIRNGTFVLRTPVTMRSGTIMMRCAIDLYGAACIKFTKRSENCVFSHNFISGEGKDDGGCCLVFDQELFPQAPVTNFKMKTEDLEDWF
jgi:hypothetical protein